MTNDLPDALIVKVARAIHDKRLPHGNWDEYKKSNPTHRYTEQAKAALQALDLPGIISDLRFYGDGENYVHFETALIDEDEESIWFDKGQRARTRLSKMGVE